MTRADKILIACIMALSLLLMVPLFFSDTEPSVAVVSVRGKEVMRLDLSRDGEYTVQGSNGAVHIRVENGAVAVSQENSLHHYCSLQGYVNSPNTPIVCLPNETVITIEGEKEGEDTVIS